jgi:hypothetical protein
MRTVTIGDKQIALRANPLALFYYRQAFGQDMVAAVMELQSKMQLVGQGDFSGMDMIGIFQLAYAMHKAAEPNKVQMSFEEWLGHFDGLGLGEEENWVVDVVQEAIDGLFRTGKPAPEKRGAKK